MHVEPPEGRIDSVKSFLGHYLMIVLSILTALGLEEWLQHLHRAEAGREARERIVAEARQNLHMLRESIALNESRRKPIEAWTAKLAAARDAHVPEARIRAEIIAPDAKTIDIEGPAWIDLRHAAWDMAVANQSIASIDPAHLAAISELYSSQQLLTTVMPVLNTGFLKYDKLVEMMVDLPAGQVDSTTLLHMLANLDEALKESNNNFRNVERLLAQVAEEPMPTKNAASTSRASSAASN